jgi:hypothetical protein
VVVPGTLGYSRTWEVTNVSQSPYVIRLRLIGRRDGHCLSLIPILDAQEIKGLEVLEYQMGRNLDILRQRRAEAIFYRTLKGKLYAFAGKLFGAYCCIRINTVRVSSLPLFVLRVTRFLDDNQRHCTCFV